MDNPRETHMPENICPCGVRLKDDPDFACDTCGDGICLTCYVDNHPGSICTPCCEKARDKAFANHAARQIA